MGPGIRRRLAILAHVDMSRSPLTNFPNTGCHHVKRHVTMAFAPSLCSRSDANCSNKESIQYSVFEVSSQGCQSSPCVRGDCEVEGLSPTPNMGINSAPSRGAPFCLQFDASKGARVPGCSIDAIRLARSGHVWTTPCMRGSGILPEALRAGGKGRVCDGRTTNSSFLDRPNTPTRHRLLARIYPSKAQIPIDPTGVHEIDVLIRFEKRDACAS